MDGFESYFTHHEFGFWIALLVLVLSLSVWVAASNLQRQRDRAHDADVLRSVESGNVPAMLAEYLTTVRAVSVQTTEMEQRVAHLYQNLPQMVRHVGLVRFSPFHDTGGDQSFSLALLDARGDGIVISALHSRNGHKLYAKPVVDRRSDYPLTEEELRAIAESVKTSGLTSAV